MPTGRSSSRSSDGRCRWRCWYLAASGARNTNSKPNWLPWTRWWPSPIYQTQVGWLLPSRVLPQDQLSSLLSENYSRIVLAVDTDKEGEEAFAGGTKVRALAQEHYGQTST